MRQARGIGRVKEVGFQSGFKSGKGIGIPDSQRKRVPEFWASDRKGSLFYFGLGSRHF